MKVAKYFGLFTLILLVAFGGCSKKEKTNTEVPVKKAPAQREELSVQKAKKKLQKSIPSDTQKLKAKIAQKEKKQPKISAVKTPSITGVWTGKFDNRKAVLKITKQKGNKFEGTIKIYYRNQINQKVSGSVDFNKKTFQMRDLLHSRYAGAYSGRILDGFKTMRGIFLMDVGNKRFRFYFKKK